LHVRQLAGVLIVAAAVASGSACEDRDLPSAASEPRDDTFADTNPDPSVFEARLVAREREIDIGPERVRLLTYADQLPGPEIRAKVGDRLIMHFENQLPEGYPTTIHWHGIEGANASDGTHTTQHPVRPGEAFTYDMRLPRPGLYWYQPHVRGAQGTHAGLYGALVVEDPDEPRLRDLGVLPQLEQTLVLSDLGTYRGGPISVEVDDDFVLMNGTEGAHLLVNGRVLPSYEVPAGEGIRLRTVNTSIARYWRLSVPGHELVRVGGQGGLLDRARIEGGTARGWSEGAEVDVDLGFSRGEVLLAPGERADLVLVPRGAPGDVVALRWEDYARGRHGMWLENGEMVMGDALDDGSRPGVDVARFVIVEGAGSYAIGEGTPILEAVGRSTPAVPEKSDALVFTGPQATVLSETMDMLQDESGRWIHEAEFFIDGVSWSHPPEHGGPELPLAPSARTAKLGDTILWEVRNDTGMSHPFHLHGFSYQPLELVRHAEDHDGEQQVEVRVPFEHVEYVDTTNIPAHSSLSFRVPLHDPNGDGGALGRWMLHCHIVQHAEAGMMSELVVRP
jgi:FtsP/CotA-like multicopper oxidase with cupredoxin domain